MRGIGICSITLESVVSSTLHLATIASVLLQAIAFSLVSRVASDGMGAGSRPMVVVGPSLSVMYCLFVICGWVRSSHQRGRLAPLYCYKLPHIGATCRALITACSQWALKLYSHTRCLLTPIF